MDDPNDLARLKWGRWPGCVCARAGGRAGGGTPNQPHDVDDDDDDEEEEDYDDDEEYENEDEDTCVDERASALQRRQESARWPATSRTCKRCC